MIEHITLRFIKISNQFNTNCIVLNSIQIILYYNAALTNTVTVRGTSREKLYQELGFEFLQQKHWYRKLCYLFKIINNQSPSYLFQLVRSHKTRYFVRNTENIPQLCTKDDFFKNSFFPLIIKEWNNLDTISENRKELVFTKAIF